LIPVLRKNPIQFTVPYCLWHYQAVITLVRILFHLLGDSTALLALPIRPRRSIEAENLFLRRQLALYQERGIKPRRVDAATRISLVLLQGCSIGAVL
jgi:putative transposase